MNECAFRLCLGLFFLLFISFRGAAALDQNALVSMEFQDTPVSVILQALADYQKQNLIITPGISGNLSLRLVDVPWQQALTTVLRIGKLSIEHEGNIMVIFTEQDAQERRQLKEKTLAEQKVQQRPLHNFILALQHADAQEIAQNLSTQREALLSVRGVVMVDKRTNTLLIRDTEESLLILKPWLTEMDLPLQQVQLAAHIVTISNDHLRELGVRWGVGPDHDDDAKKNVPRINNLNVNFPLQSSAITAGFSIARISGRLLDLELSALEQENQVEIIASPRLITSHQQVASIKQGTEIPYIVSSGPNNSTSVEFKEAVLGMEVTPKILRNGKITLKLQISQNMPGAAIKRGETEALTINKQEIKTQVTVNNGETIVLGGIFQHKKNQHADKVPVLADIPLLGALFKQNSHQKKRRELVIFITPKLIKS